jgi:hypothetical protein
VRPGGRDGYHGGMSDRVESSAGAGPGAGAVPGGRRAGRRWRVGRAAAVVAGVVLGGLVGGEMFARHGLGLGDPPLSMADAEIEYLFVPSQSYRRFGNRVAYNQWHMRSEPFGPVKAGPDERRVVFLGDSVINGGSQTDQSELATELLRRRLSERTGWRVVTGNASAGSWGPPNMLAYVERFGVLDADVVVIVVSSHDASDVPTWEPVVGVHPGFPDRRPRLALEEAVTRYLPRYVPGWGGSGGDGVDPMGDARVAEADARAEALGALEALIERAGEAGAAVVVAQHLERSELAEGGEGVREGHGLIRAVAERAGATVVQLGPAFEAALAAAEAGVGPSPYRDNIHPSVHGQRVLAEALEPTLVALLGAR